MTGTRYTDPSGLAAATVSTAADQVLLGRAVMAQPVLAGIVATRTAVVPVAGPVRNLNRLLGSDQIVGLKTGNTSAAAGCVLLAAWHRVSGRRMLIIAAVFGQPGALSASLANALAAGRQLVLAVDHALDHPARAHAALAGRLRQLRADALAGVRVEEVQRGQVHRDLGGLALLDRGPGIHRGHEQDLPQRLGRLRGARGLDRGAT